MVTGRTISSGYCKGEKFKQVNKNKTEEDVQIPFQNAQQRIIFRSSKTVPLVLQNVCKQITHSLDSFFSSIGPKSGSRVLCCNFWQHSAMVIRIVYDQNTYIIDTKCRLEKTFSFSAEFVVTSIHRQYIRIYSRQQGRNRRKIVLRTL